MNKDMLKRNDRPLGAVVVAWLFATVGAVMGAVMWDLDFSAMGGVWIVLFAAILLVLLLGWRPLPEPPGSRKAPTVADHSAGVAPGSAPTARSSGGEAPSASAASGTAAASTPSSGMASATSAAPAKAPAAEPEPAPETAPETVAEAEVEAEVAGTKPTALDAPREGEADDLKQIKGVGPALERLCHSLGFYHFDQIANWTEDEVAWVDQNLEGFKGRVTRDDWVAQAKVLAAGGSTEFSEKVEKGDVYQ